MSQSEKQKLLSKASISSSGKQVTYPQRKDVLLGRGNYANHHWGNIRLRAMVKERAPQFSSTHELAERDNLAKQVIEDLQKEGSRFLREVEAKPDVDERNWEIAEQNVVLRKVKQAFRDTIRLKEQSSSKSSSKKPPAKKKAPAQKSPVTDDVSRQQGPAVPSPYPEGSDVGASLPTQGGPSQLDWLQLQLDSARRRSMDNSSGRSSSLSSLGYASLQQQQQQQQQQPLGGIDPRLIELQRLSNLRAQQQALAPFSILGVASLPQRQPDLNLDRDALIAALEMERLRTAQLQLQLEQQGQRQQQGYVDPMLSALQRQQPRADHRLSFPGSRNEDALIAEMRRQELERQQQLTVYTSRGMASLPQRYSSSSSESSTRL